MFNERNTDTPYAQAFLKLLLLRSDRWYLRQSLKKKPLNGLLHLNERNNETAESLIAIENISFHVEAIFQEFDDNYNREHQLKDVKCRECKRKICCNFLRPKVHLLEILPLAFRLYNSHSITEEFVEYLTNSKLLYLQLLGMPRYLLKFRNPCLFLGELGQCEVWDWRPIACRSTWRLDRQCKIIDSPQVAERSDLIAFDRFRQLYSQLGFARIVAATLPAALHYLAFLFHRPTEFLEEAMVWPGFFGESLAELPVRRLPSLEEFSRPKGFLF